MSSMATKARLNNRTELNQMISHLYREYDLLLVESDVLARELMDKLNTHRSAIIKKAIDKWQQDTGEILPLRGTIHDLGKTFTHKRQIIELHLCSKIARTTQHDPVNVDCYIKDFKRVLEFAQESASVEKICFLPV